MLRVLKINFIFYQKQNLRVFNIILGVTMKVVAFESRGKMWLFSWISDVSMGLKYFSAWAWYIRGLNVREALCPSPRFFNHKFCYINISPIDFLTFVTKGSITTVRLASKYAPIFGSCSLQIYSKLIKRPLWCLDLQKNHLKTQCGININFSCMIKCN